MPFTAQYLKSLQIGSTTLSQNIRLTGDGNPQFSFSIPAASTGTLTTRTDNDTGVVTAASGHGIVTSDTVGVFWTDGNGNLAYRVGMTATVSGDLITVDGGDSVSGSSNLPALNSSVTISKLVTENLGAPVVLSGLLALAIEQGSNETVCQLHTGPAAQAKVNFALDNTGYVSAESPASLFSVSTDTTISAALIYPASTSPGTLNLTFLTP